MFQAQLTHHINNLEKRWKSPIRWWHDWKHPGVGYPIRKLYNNRKTQWRNSKSNLYLQYEHACELFNRQNLQVLGPEEPLAYCKFSDESKDIRSGYCVSIYYVGYGLELVFSHEYQSNPNLWHVWIPLFREPSKLTNHCCEDYALRKWLWHSFLWWKGKPNKLQLDGK